jgi:hypothetical protein
MYADGGAQARVGRAAEGGERSEDGEDLDHVAMIAWRLTAGISLGQNEGRVVRVFTDGGGSSLMGGGKWVIT